ncbi:MAG: integrase core domain-containing protein [Synergistes sp.]|nr:integrase core domain-containing protein [Synergistes sp.]
MTIIYRRLPVCTDKSTQEVRFRQALISYAEKYGVTKAAIRYKTNRQYIYRWKRRYDGTDDSLKNKTSRPLHHPNEHRGSELKMINDMYIRNQQCGLVVLWVKLRERGCSGSISSLYRVLRKRGLKREKPANPKYVPRPYEHRLIRPFTPRHNGKVERSHRKDNEYFYALHKFYSLEDFDEQLAVRCRKYNNNFPMRPLYRKSPREALEAFLSDPDSVTQV